MSHRYRVAVAKEMLGFSAAHFLALEGHMCERLHGHNYRLSIVAAGEPDPATGFLVDFAVLKRVLRAQVDPMDHRLLLPAHCPSLVIREAGDRLVVDYRRTEWLVLPREHACLLPVVHTTAELLAQHLVGETWRALHAEGVAGLTELEVEVEESAGQAASFRMQRPPD